MVEKNSKVKYTGKDTSVLTNGETCKVFRVFDDGIRVYIPTGFSGIPNDRFELVK